MADLFLEIRFSFRLRRLKIIRMFVCVAKSRKTN